VTIRIHFEGRPFELEPGETVLGGLERHGVRLPSFCRTGVCQTCLVKATAGRPSARSQEGLKDSWVQQGCFLACLCVADGPLEVATCDAVGTFASRVARVEPLTAGVLRVELEAPPELSFRAGQFVQLERPGGVTRPYSIASLPGAAGLELHVARMEGGAMSGWLPSATGQAVTVRGPFGECFYLDQEPERPLLLAGTGTGLAPLVGVVRAALAAGHRGAIHLYHGSPSSEGLYLWRELSELVERAPSLRVFGSVLAEPAGFAAVPRCEVSAQPLERLILADPLDFAACRVYLAGHPELVQRLKKRLYLAGAPLARIHADPFVAPAAR
jgi:CDP-4-dehydro-6-deoxyglucose reductase